MDKNTHFASMRTQVRITSTHVRGRHDFAGMILQARLYVPVTPALWSRYRRVLKLGSQPGGPSNPPVSAPHSAEVTSACEPPNVVLVTKL